MANLKFEPIQLSLTQKCRLQSLLMDNIDRTKRLVGAFNSDEINGIYKNDIKELLAIYDIIEESMTDTPVKYEELMLKINDELIKFDDGEEILFDEDEEDEEIVERFLDTESIVR